MKPTITQIKEAARRYLKIVEWSDDDQCYVGSAPPLIGQSCHGKTEADVIKQLQDAGHVVARGTPSDIQRNPRVIEAYVGLEG